MAYSSSKEASETQQSEYEDVTEFFDLEAASLPSEAILAETLANLLPNAPDDLKFEPITGEKTDQFEAWLKHALELENDSGGRGPYVFPWSADMWFGEDGKDLRELPSGQETDETPGTKGTVKSTRRVRIDPELITKIMEQLKRL